ncbi:type II secretion system protein [Thalassotalea aquiviva]|uniref:type II secretion system protein n=1 Tax=Thalassotalea aquiviva TaxID=3242415 RepID=UPI00352AC620
MNKPSTPYQNKHGFTLIELVLVILIISILSVYLGPRLLGQGGVNVIAYRNQMISTLRLLQQQAMQDTAELQCHQLLVDTSRYGIPDQRPCFKPSFSSLWEPDNRGFVFPDAANISLKSTATELTFDSWGRVKECDRKQGCIITFTGEVKVSICIESQGYIHAC